jgi:hypothetical protein
VRVGALGCAALAAAGCAMMQSSSLEIGPGLPACSSNAGSYFLPKTMFRLGVDQRTTGSGDTKRSNFELAYLVAFRRSDGTKPYCLDYLASVTSKDEINVVKYSPRLVVQPANATEAQMLAAAKQRLIALGMPSDALSDARSLPELNAEFDSNLLRYVASDAVDQSAYIVQALTTAIFTGVAGVGAAPRAAGLAKPEEGKPLRVAEHDFDPFDPLQSAIINQSLRDFGFCIVVAGVTFDPSLMTVQQYCDDPMRRSRLQPAFNRKLEAARAHNDVKDVRGILYRPRVPYRVHVFLKADLSRPGGWTLRKSEVIAMENIAPIIAVGVDRAFFAQRKTALVFDQGSLSNVCIYKTSELQKFAEIPLEVVKSVVALPTTIVQLRIINTNNETALIKAHDAILRNQETALQTLATIRADTTTPVKIHPMLGLSATELGDVDVLAQTSASAQFYAKSNFAAVCPAEEPK